ncbi:hypothetical protein KORDIASMS9_00975 [Kordia sp. SMS9]|uniref:hypothetical protein n=1 Tax=Kordia sp. SMS9 TaxID=2282170 RepID=UPI000E10216A|nr:hypothetical protein [Kordia sp. SMS9]AXG68759.1 hypothetical protein KORDIASMS9_00975 [Kordia sp. SMS9]
MKKQILQVKGATALTKKEQRQINGGNPIAICDRNGDCPSGSSCAPDGLCYRDANGGSGSGGCNEPMRICVLPETGCGCVYF